MSDASPPLTTFEDLRRVGIGYAQDASGEVWTDYNVHDPGVTLLEQTCFALSQLAYQTALPTRDLLTTEQGDFLFREIGFAPPRKVLRTAPVTRDDLERWLSECPDVEGVSLRPRGDSHPGFYDMVIFGGGEPAPVLEAKMRTAFDRVRPLGTALGAVTVAQRLDVVLHGTVEIAAGALPNTMAAEIYHTIRAILSGQAMATEVMKGATRDTVFDAPERLFEAPRRAGVPTLRADNTPRKSRKSEPQTEISLASSLSLIRALPGVQEIETLSLRLRYPENPPPITQPYLYLVFPRHPEHIELTLTVDGAPMLLSPTHVREDYARIRAERMSQSHHHIHAPDWDVLKPGRRRSFDLGHVDALLPGPYSTAGYRPTDDQTPLLAQYRALIDGVLQDMRAALGTLPDTFHANKTRDFSDPGVYRARLTLLDYLLALQGFEMPAIRHTGLNCYRGTTARHRFDLTWRMHTLSVLPELHATRATAPGIEGPRGFLASLALLCDLDLAVGAGTCALDAYGLRLAQHAPLNAQPKMTAITEIDGVNLLDLLPLEDPDAQPYDPDAFAGFLPFVADGTLCPEHFHRLSKPEAIRVVPCANQTWQVVVDFGGATAPWPVANFDSTRRDPRRDAFVCAARLRATWRALHRRCETLRLLEPDLTCAGAIAPFMAVLLLPGWTARCALPSFRQYVETQVARLAPAHIHVSVIWQEYVAPDRSDARAVPEVAP